MARVPLYRDATTSKVAATLKPGTNVTFAEAEVGGVLEVTVNASGGGGGGGGAPTTASYLTLGTDATLTAERVFTHSARLSHTDGGAGGNYALDLNVSGVSAGTYTYASVTVDAYGRVTSASSGAAPVAPPSPASSVIAETSYGQSSATGTSLAYARQDHTHGTPAVPAHSATTGLAWGSSGHTGLALAVATWDGTGSASPLKATTDETMLVRRGGVLQWVPLIVGVGFLPASREQAYDGRAYDTTIPASMVSGAWTT